MTIRTEAFAGAFERAWRHAIEADPDKRSPFRARDGERTRAMLGDRERNGQLDSRPDAVLRRAALHYQQALTLPHLYGPVCWYTIDHLYVRPMDVAPVAKLVGASQPPLNEGDPWPDYWRYAALLAIEHENGCDVETEMWKLAHWRCPLKVLVFYDFDMQDREKARRYVSDWSLGEVTDHREWLERKLKQLASIIRGVHQSDQSIDEEYLIIVGRPRRWRDGDAVAWRMDRWDARANQLVTIRPMAEFI